MNNISILFIGLGIGVWSYWIINFVRGVDE